MAYEDRWTRDRDWERRDRYDFDDRAGRDERYDEERRRQEERSFRPFGDVGPSAYGPGDQGRQPSEPRGLSAGRDERGPRAGRGYGGSSPAWDRDYPRGDYGQGLGAGPWASYSGARDYGRSYETLDRGYDTDRSYQAQDFGERSAWEQPAQSLFGGGRQGSHRGRGPKGYRRSDERVREDVSDRLMDDPFLDASDLEVSVQDCEVTLSGTVATREDKRRAERLAEDVSGVNHVQNNLRVQSRDEQTTFNVGRADTSREF